MILSLLKNRGLRHQLLMGLLLVLGTFPEPSGGLKCYVCSDAPDLAAKYDLPRCTNPRQVDLSSNPAFANIGYCYTIDAHNGAGDKLVSKYYAHNVQADCMKKEFGSSCKGATDEAGTNSIVQTIERCTEEAVKAIEQGKGRKENTNTNKPSYTTCLCNTDLCNSDRFCGNDDCDYSGAGHLSSSILHPFNSIIITILTVALCT